MASRERILIVDDTPDNILLLREILDDYTVLAAANGPEALEVAATDPQPDCILLDVLMPVMDGYEVCRRLKAQERTRHIPVLFVTTLHDTQDETRGLELGAVDYITKPVRPPVVRARVRNHLRLKAYQEHLEALVDQRTQGIVQTEHVAILTLAALAETRDNELGGHFQRTQHTARLLAENLVTMPDYLDFFRETGIEVLFHSLPLHDVGKVGIPDRILLKPGRLTPEEFAIMKLHTVYGRDILKRAEGSLAAGSFLATARDVAYTHHEKWDGTGYPQGLAGRDIPLCGRIMAVADVYDALISKRVYKQPIAHRDAVTIIAQGRGTFFEPAIVDIFLSHQEAIRRLSLEFADVDEERRALGA